MVGRVDEKYGQRLTAFVVLRPDAADDVRQLNQYVLDHLANYTVPRDIAAVIDALPRKSTGKIVRKDLKALLDG